MLQLLAVSGHAHESASLAEHLGVSPPASAAAAPSGTALGGGLLACAPGIGRHGTAAAGCSAGGEHAPRQLPPYTLPAGTEVASYEGAAQSGLADAAVASLHLAARASRLPVVGVDAEWVAGRAVSVLPLEKQWFVSSH